MFTVSKLDVMLIEGKLVGDASQIGLRPGEWPDFIAVLDERNEGFLFSKGRPDVEGGEVAGYRYFAKSGEELLVIND